MTTTPTRREYPLTDEQYHKFTAIMLYRDSVGQALGYSLTAVQCLRGGLNQAMAFHWQVCQEVVLVTGYGNEWEYLVKELGLTPEARWSFDYIKKSVVEMLPGQY